jgi:hypothetical protein
MYPQPSILLGSFRLGSYKVPSPMYWPLAAGFIAFVLIAVIIGWILDPDRHGGAGNDRH